MVRTARFDPDDFVDAAIALVAEGGPSAATLAAIARKVGAPTGSVYHRFESRGVILAAAWLRVQGRLAAAVVPPLADGDLRGAALALVGWARRDRVGARFLLLNDDSALLDDQPPEAERAAMEAAQTRLDAAFARALPAGAPPETLARARFLAFDGPAALLRPHLLSGDGIPDYVDRAVADLHAALPLKAA
ncbi:MAG TPA: TetR/AcrR family transcriptional regulator [Alphaproteobacteria bacterium]|nr:TetR/AcrR family transcriptional regulator [Alphaproteobacteria bacterium]